MQTEKATNLENFSLRPFLEDRSIFLEERRSLFNRFLQKQEHSGQAFYRRVLHESCSRKTTVFDSLSQKPKKRLMFGSNNYLGFGNHAEIQKKVAYAIEKYGGGPPLLNGTTDRHILLERGLAAFKHQEDTVIFSSGFMAQWGWITALINKGDTVFFDACSHASLVEGLKLSGCRTYLFKHNNLSDLGKKLKNFASDQGENWICIEGVYSMDGDIADLPGILAIARKFNCRLAIDDAHGTGVSGRNGKGVVEHFEVNPGEIDIYYGTFSKTFATLGGFICARKKVAFYIRFMVKSHMFSAALPVPVIETVLAGLDIIRNNTGLIKNLHDNVRSLLNGFRMMGLETTSDSGIIPVFIPQAVDIRALALAFHKADIFLNSVEYPAVPADKQRLRISVMSTHTQEDSDYLLRVCGKLFLHYRIIHNRDVNEFFLLQQTEKFL